jgi:hypothetical protein
VEAAGYQLPDGIVETMIHVDPWTSSRICNQKLKRNVAVLSEVCLDLANGPCRATSSNSRTLWESL